ncbi:hypothetical protein RJ55_01696 [Drechmeria coniospora]|nr:hypothetical protein RJ55_01696 [Drechmeria coniospora]
MNTSEKFDASASRGLLVRRIVAAVASRFSNRRFVFSLAAVAVIGAKIVHIYAHLSSLSTVHLLQWGYSFFAQDTALLVILRLLLDASLLASAPVLLQLLSTTLAAVVIAYIAALGAIQVAFFAVAGNEIHWRNITVAGDASSRALLLSGSLTLALVLCLFVAVAWAAQDLTFALVGYAAHVVAWPFVNANRILWPRAGRYSEIPQHDVEDGGKPSSSQPAGWSAATLSRCPWRSLFRLFAHLLAAVAMLAHVVLFALRPHESSMTFMSWTPALLPFVDFKNSSPNLDKLVPTYGSGIDRAWDDRTALADPVRLPWLPPGPALAGFEDWYAGRKHYSAAADPLKASNLDDDLLEPLRGKLREAPIRHVMIVMLESTRKDLFPIKKDGLIWNRFASSFENKTLPEAAQRRLQTLTPTANYLTGDYADGFAHAEPRRRGGLNCNDAYTTATYTLKSIAGLLCGLSPLVADFNRESDHHFYQPCLPQLLDAFNAVDHDGDPDAFTSYKWRSSFLQSVVLKYDGLDRLVSDIGFADENVIGREYLKSSSAKFGTVHEPDINYFGMSEVVLDKYIRDAFASARKNDERVFMTHVTSTSHHPYAMPADEEYVPLSNGLDDLSHYVNAIGYDDRWLDRVLSILDAEGVANETLVVLVGDHGLSIPENDVLASYYNPNVGSNHVPLVLSHPKLPLVDVDGAVSSLQVLPTILDLLRETGSLPKAAAEAARDLAANYEGQSLLRPMRSNNQTTRTGSGRPAPHGDWQFTVINPGSAMLGVRDARPENGKWRLVVPVVDNVEWRFSNLDSDPTEKYSVRVFEFSTFLRLVEERYGVEAARWAEEGAFVARWWVEENSRRWRYGPNSV